MIEARRTAHGVIWQVKAPSTSEAAELFLAWALASIGDPT